MSRRIHDIRYLGQESLVKLKILVFLSRGYSYDDIAECLIVNKRVVHYHMRAMRDWFDCKTNLQLICKAVKAGII
jgi:DNA-binding CsgD family transcriptional regulator